MNILFERTRLLGVLNGTFTRLVVAIVVGIVLYGHTKDFSELCPVGDIVALVDDPRSCLDEHTEVSRLSYEEEVGIFVPGSA